ncbi:sensor histidine kinase [Ketogulonicigenium vulgare]|uniref:sensor histidine kinase n=1 Tax=Ketogulonicigenium vulgare TaxID=92945 RepID=UPI00235825A5|nr:ATP-binding protein [Ketogulonicigenium vulgare]
MPNRLRKQTVILTLVSALGVAAAVASFRVMTDFYLEQTAQRADNTLGLAVTALKGQLDRYRQLPDLLAAQQNIQMLAGNPDDPVRIAQMDAYLKTTAEVLEASDIYIMRTDGTTISASNYDLPTSFVGENFAYRPYFIDAIGTGRGQFFGLGTTSLRRGYYYSADIQTDTGTAGVIALKVDVESIESAWHGADYEIVVTDPSGIVFMSGRPDWLFSALLPLTDERLVRTQATRRYADADLTELPLLRSETRRGRALMTLVRSGPNIEYLVASEAMPEADWTVQVLVDTGPARLQARVAVAITLLAFSLSVAGMLLWLQRRAALRERQSHQREVQEQLERRVTQRTQDLAVVNDQLQREVAERRSTEVQLRKTQTDLIQAAKLAALGQMSAELSHEFNQPLAALRSFIESAQTLITRGRIADAAQYLQRIDGLTERMTAISRHLSSFARKPGEQLTDVPLAEVITDALALLDWRIRADGVEIVQDVPPLTVHGGRVRLQQVLVNVIANALDAMEDRPTRRLTIRAEATGDQIRLTLRDTGIGVPDTIRARIFDPFFSTKGVGRGLGLGLSISYNIIKDFGGELAIATIDGGAEVTIWLKQHIGGQ